MKRLISLPLILSFVGIAVFGFAFFDMGSSHDGGCIASIVDRTTCPTNVASMALLHISAAQTLTMSMLPSISGWLLLFAALLLVSVSIFLFYKSLLLPKRKFLPQRLRDLKLHSLYSKQKITSWLSLFELSPAL